MNELVQITLPQILQITIDSRPNSFSFPRLRQVTCQIRMHADRENQAVALIVRNSDAIAYPHERINSHCQITVAGPSHWEHVVRPDLCSLLLSNAIAVSNARDWNGTAGKDSVMVINGSNR